MKILYDFYIWICSFFISEVKPVENTESDKNVDKQRLRELYVKKYDTDKQTKKNDTGKKTKHEPVSKVSRYSNYGVSSTIYSSDIHVVKPVNDTISETCTVSFFDKTETVKIYFDKTVKFRVISEGTADVLGLGGDDIFSKPIDTIDDTDIYSAKVEFNGFEFNRVAIDLNNKIAKSLSITDDHYIILSKDDMKYVSDCGYNMGTQKVDLQTA